MYSSERLIISFVCFAIKGELNCMLLRKTSERLVLLEINEHPKPSDYLQMLSKTSGSYHIPPNKLVCFKRDYELKRLQRSIINNGAALSNTDLDIEELVQLNDENLFIFANEMWT